jgi:NNP family nitrate/nitrite transporter-like MFS transporter
MFTKEIAGIANGLVGGWGTCGGGATQVVMGTGLFPLFKYIFDGDAEKAWRVVCIVPAVAALFTGIIVITTSVDCPKGNYTHLKKEGSMIHVSASASFGQGATEFNTWLLFINYGCCSGVELTVYNAAVGYFVSRYDLTLESASVIASICGFMSVFARAMGGVMSDKAMGKFNMRGRIMVQAMLLILEGVFIFIFANMQQLWASILMFTIFSIFTHFAQGSTYGIVPYVNPEAPGAVAGIVAAGAATGAV